MALSAAIIFLSTLTIVPLGGFVLLVLILSSTKVELTKDGGMQDENVIWN